MGKHNRALCPKHFGNSSSFRTPAASQGPQNSASSNSAAVAQASDFNTVASVVPSEVVPKMQNLAIGVKSATFLTAHVKVRKPSSDRILPVHLIFDSGSHLSFITSALAHRLELPKMGQVNLSVSTFASEGYRRMDSATADIEIFLKNGSIKPVSVNVLPKLTGEVVREPLSTSNAEFLSKLPPYDLADIVPYCSDCFLPEILIGIDHFWDFMTQMDHLQLPSGLWLVPSTIGLLLSGCSPVPVSESRMVHSNIAQIYSAPHELTDFLVPSGRMKSSQTADFWSLEMLGIDEPKFDSETERVMQEFKETVTYVDNRYYIHWPWI